MENLYNRTYKNLKIAYLLILSIPLMIGCKSYKAHLMFKYGEDYAFQQLQAGVLEAQVNYTIQPDDLLEVVVYTKGGERIIDPDLQLLREMGGNVNAQNLRKEHQYLVLGDSTVTLPMIGNTKLGGLTIEQANRSLEEIYSAYFTEPFILITYVNKRVVVLGAAGGLVVPLRNENTHLAEIVATAGGVNRNMRADNIRLIRGKDVFLIDFSTLEGFQNSNMVVESGDIIYIEPVPRVVSQSAQEISLIISTITAFTTLLLVFLR